MIVFKDGNVDEKKANALVGFGPNAKADAKKAEFTRDSEGHLTVTVDHELRPEPGEAVYLCTLSEGNGEYHGVVAAKGDDLLFVPN